MDRVAEKSPLGLVFDTYKRTSPFLDVWWLRELLEGRHGDLPANLLLVMARRDELDKNQHEQIREAIRDLEDFLTVFPGHQTAQAFKQSLEKRLQGENEPNP